MGGGGCEYNLEMLYFWNGEMWVRECLVLILDLDHDVMVHLCWTVLFSSMMSTYVSVSNGYTNFSLLGSLLLHSSDWCG
jgi:hypothetical protein